MKAKKNLALVAAGIVIGAFLAFPTAHAAEELFTAVRSSHQFFLDGKQVQMEAYIINGNNYVMLLCNDNALGRAGYCVKHTDPSTGHCVAGLIIVHPRQIMVMQSI